MDNVILLPNSLPIKGELVIDEDIVARLRGLLADAEAGVIRSFVYGVTNNEEMCRYSWAGKGSRQATGYMIARLQHDFFQACNREDSDD